VNSRPHACWSVLLPLELLYQSSIMLTPSSFPSPLADVCRRSENTGLESSGLTLGSPTQWLYVGEFLTLSKWFPIP
jgi:hypothetical protein